MTPPQIITYNLEACERVLTRAHRTAPTEPVTLSRSVICNAPYELTEALAWALGRVQELEGKENNGSR